MTGFPPSILDYWDRAFAGHSTVRAYAISATLNPKRPAMILEPVDGPAHMVVRPELADRIGAGDRPMEDLAKAGVVLHDPDHLFYLSDHAPRPPDRSMAVRQLTASDRSAFDAFLAEASEQDREDAFVELDHWAVFGRFAGDRLVSAASAILWDEGPIADLGVLTLPDVRGQGYARAVVRSINGFVRQREYEPQYRCQLDNHASIALARSCDMALFGQLIVATAASEQGDG